MYAFCLIGMTKQGKSRYARRLITERGQENFGAFVNDVNDEYGQYRRDRETGALMPSVGLTTDVTAYRSRYVHDMDKGGNSMKEYLKLVARKKNTTCIFEECTAFFKGRTPDVLCEIIINKGHTLNNYVFCFHSIRSVPPELLGLMDYVVLFKTADNESIVKGKDQKLLPYWLKLQGAKDGTQPFAIAWQTEVFNEQRYNEQRKRFFNTK